MIDLYAIGNPNVVKIYIALDEMGLPYNRCVDEPFPPYEDVEIKG